MSDNMRILGIDYGEKRIGLAISSLVGRIAQGLPTIERSDGNDLLEKLANIIREKEVEQIIVGLPKNMNNTVGEQAEEVLGFVEHLKSKFSLPVFTIDERLTTVRAQRIMTEAGVSKKDKKNRVDMIAAQLILQCYLDKKKFEAPEI